MCRLIILILCAIIAGAIPGVASANEVEAVQAESTNAQWDEETRRYRAELQQIGIETSMIDIQSSVFAAALPDKRAKMWADVETVREELAKEDTEELREIREQINSPAYDAETLSYIAALEKAGKSSQEVNGLVTLFSISKPQVRKVLWDDLKTQ